MANPMLFTISAQLEQGHDLSVANLDFALRYLSHYGYLKDPNLAQDNVTEAAMKFQSAYGIESDGIIGPQTLEAMWVPRCGVRDDAFTLAAKWRKRELRWWVDRYLEGIPGLSRFDQDDLQILSLQDYESVIDVKWSRAANRSQADLLVSVGEGRVDQMDGPGGVLAWCEIPQGNDQPVRMKFDKGDIWIKSADQNQRGILYGNVDRHEKGHGHGMLHISGETALLNPFYSPQVGRLLDPDKKALLALGYAKTPTAPPPTDYETITITIQGKVTSASVPGFRIIPLV